jgi:hypothetical protein
VFNGRDCLASVLQVQAFSVFLAGLGRPRRAEGWTHRVWKVFEAPGVEAVFLKKDQATNYALNRASFRSGEIHVFDSSGNLERVIPFTETDRRL